MFVNISYHSVKFGGHRHSGSGDIMVFNYHVTLQDHMIKELFEFMIWRPSKYDHRHRGSGGIMVLVCQGISQDDLIKRPCDFLGKRPSKQVTILQNLVATATLVMEL